MPHDAALIATLSQLIAIPSIGGTPGEVAIQHHLAQRLAELGLEVDLWPIDLAGLRAREDFPGEEVDRAQAWGLVGTHRPGERPTLVLEGHVDVVPTGDRAAWTGDPFTPGGPRRPDGRPRRLRHEGRGGRHPGGGRGGAVGR
jgi:acetylornithine deacetylase